MGLDILSAGGRGALLLPSATMSIVGQHNRRTDKCAQTSNMVVFAQAYYMAAKMIADNILENNSGYIADALVFPMLFDTNQFVELYLKALQALLNELLGHEEEFDGGHNLDRHYGKFVSLLNEFEREHPGCKGDRREFNDMMSSVADYVGELKTRMPERSRMSDKHTNQFYRDLPQRESSVFEVRLHLPHRLHTEV